MLDLVLESTIGRVLAFAASLGLVAAGAQELGVAATATLLALGFTAGWLWRER